MNLASYFAVDRWPLSRLSTVLLAGAFVGLMVDIRYEHVEVVHEHGAAWIPIIYSGVMAIACVAAGIAWSPAVRRVMRALFCLAFVVGGLGFYFHNRGRMAEVATASISAWTDPTMTHSEAPPPTAPLAFAGLGMIGILASLERFNPQPRKCPCDGHWHSGNRPQPWLTGKEDGPPATPQWAH